MNIKVHIIDFETKNIGSVIRKVAKTGNPKKFDGVLIGISHKEGVCYGCVVDANGLISIHPVDLIKVVDSDYLPKI
jgi:hypothetical protein